jgi:hypothetical protein
MILSPTGGSMKIVYFHTWIIINLHENGGSSVLKKHFGELTDAVPSLFYLIVTALKT